MTDSFFKQLYDLARTTSVGVIATADEAKGLMSLNVTPMPTEKNANPALKASLHLIGTPDEFDTDFLPALKQFRIERTSLAEQIRVNAAKMKQAGATTTLREASKSDPIVATPTAQHSSTEAPAREAGANDDTAAGSETSSNGSVPTQQTLF